MPDIIGIDISIDRLDSITTVWTRRWQRRGMRWSKVNPRQARRFAEAVGVQARTNRGDAMLLARMGLALDLPVGPVRGELMNELSGLQVARLALIKDRTAVGTLAIAGLLRGVVRKTTIET